MSFEREGLIRRRWATVLLAYFVLAFGGMVPIMVVLHRSSFAAAAAALVGYVAVLVGTAAFWARVWRFTRGRITADERGLFVDGVCLEKRADLRHAYVLNDKGKVYLRLVRKSLISRPVDIEVEDEPEAQRILAALRLDAQSSVAEYEFTDGTPKSDRTKMAYVAIGFVNIISLALLVFFRASHHPGSEVAMRVTGLLMYLFATAGSGFAMQSRMVKISVGADGLRLRQLARGTRFIPFRDLKDVSLSDKTITLRLVDGSEVSVHSLVEGRGELGSDREREGAGLVARIREAHAAYRATPAATAHALGRGDRTATEWMQHARKVRENVTSYRDAAVPDDELWRIVEDASASASERAGAALALRHGIDDAGRHRLRLAAEACAETRLRVALETATLEDDEALENALEPLRA